MLPLAWVSLDFDLLPKCTSNIILVASMAEEVHNPSVQLPRALSWSIPIGFVTGVLFLLPILFTLPDIPTLLAGAYER